MGSFQSPGAHPSELPAKLLLSPSFFLLSFLSFPFDFLVPLLLLLVFDLLPSLRPLFNLHRLFPLSPQQNFSLSHPYLFYPLFPFHSSSSLSDPPPLQPCIIRPKHKPAQAHIWKKFGHGSFLPRRLNI